MKRLPLDVSNFKLMIEGDYAYIDKTHIIYDLLRDRRLFFLSRPRRFGKSLLISTLFELFSGNELLFRNTWIGKSKNFAWQEYPVIYLDFSVLSNDTSPEFKTDLSWALEQIAESYGTSLAKAPSLNTKFTLLVEKLAQNNKVVILIDEYDYPLLANITKPTVAKALQKTIRDFFTVIKSLDKHIRCVFITGVTRFSKTSIFSGMNNLNDITMSPEAAALLGYSSEEIQNSLISYIKKFAAAEKMPVEKMMGLIQQWYNGYRFSRDTTKVYNPYSVIHALHAQKFSNYWLETGTPSFLVELLKSHYADIETIETTELSSELLGTFEIHDIPLAAILFQTGYLTIADYDKTIDRYKLTYPNTEVAASFKRYIVESLSQANARAVDQAIIQCKEALQTEDIDRFITIIRNLFANIPYQLHINKEAYYHTLFHVIIDLLGYNPHSESPTSKGRIDLAMDTSKRIYIFEFKINSKPEIALEQIEQQRYYEKYARLKKPISLIGLAFNYKKKELALEYVVKEAGSRRSGGRRD